MTIEIHDRNNIPRLLNAFPKEKERILRVAGAFLEGKIKELITETPSEWPKLHPFTIQRKKSDKPLIDTGTHILNRITHKVEGDVVKVGVFGEEALIASVHEFGCKIRVTEKMRKFLHAQGLHLRKDTEYITIPQRSFLRLGFDKNKEEIERLIDKNVKAVVEKFVIKL
ncbi:phage virion morphogenesis protein [Archaeoglobus sp.]